MNHYRFLEVEKYHQVTRVRFTDGHLNGELAKGIGDELTRVVNEPGPDDLHLDFGNVETLSAAMLGRLVALYIELRSVGRALVLFNLHARIYEVFQVMGLTQLLDIRQAGPQIQVMQQN